MGVLRGGLLVFVGILLFFSLLLLNATLVLFTSMEYGPLSVNLAPAVHEIVSDQVPEQVFLDMENRCQSLSAYSFTYEDLDFSLNIPCERITQGREQVIEYSVDVFLEKVYYDNYDCEFWDCVSNSEYPFVLMSAKAQTYWKSKFYLFLIVSLILAVLAFLLFSKKLNFLMFLGLLTVGSAIPLRFLGKIFAAIIPISGFENLVLVFVSSANKVFLVMLIIGFVLFATGLILKILTTGDNIVTWFKNRNKDSIKKK